MAYRLKLVRSESSKINYQYVGAYRLRIEASDPTNSGMPAEVFLWHRKPINPYTGEADDVALCVCSPADMAEYPIGEPDPDSTYPLFRLSYVEFDLRSIDKVQKIWEIIVREVDQLLVGMEQLETLVPAIEVWVGDAPDSGSSDSDSSSV